MKVRICEECGEECDTKTIDVGEGAYEFHGQRGHDVRWADVSSCCEAGYDDISQEQFDGLKTIEKTKETIAALKDRDMGDKPVCSAFEAILEAQEEVLAEHGTVTDKLVMEYLGYERVI